VIDYSRLPSRQEVSAFADIGYIDVGQLTGISNHETIAPVATPSGVERPDARCRDRP
jgi:hypothetical protein